VTGLVVVGNDDEAPKYNFISVTTAAAPSTTTLAIVSDDALTVAPGDSDSAVDVDEPVVLDDSPYDAITKMPPGLPLIKCDRSTTVRLVQELLVALGNDVRVDGDLGPDRQTAVATFQGENNFTVDGIVDGPTFDLLCTSAPGDLCTD